MEIVPLTFHKFLFDILIKSITCLDNYYCYSKIESKTKVNIQTF